MFRLFKTFQLKDGDPRKCLNRMAPLVGFETNRVFQGEQPPVVKMGR